MKEFNETFNGYPTLEQAKKSIDELSKYSWERFELEDNLEEHIEKIRTKLFSDGFVGIPSLIQESNESYFPFNFYRVRALDEFSNINLPSEYSYPPRQFCKSVQRVNYPNYPVFYASAKPSTSIIEVIKANHNKNPERKYCISKWKINTCIGLNFAPFVFHDDTEDNPCIEFVKRIYSELPRIFNGLSNDKIEAIKLRMKYYCQAFLNDDKYAISTYIGHSYIYPSHDKRADIFMYPSVQLDKKSLNFAIHPDCVDERMSLDRVYIGKIDKLDLSSNLYGLSISKYAQVNNGFFDWKEIKLNDETYKQYLKEDFGEALQSTFIPIQD